MALYLSHCSNNWWRRSLCISGARLLPLKTLFGIALQGWSLVGFRAGAVGAVAWTFQGGWCVRPRGPGCSGFQPDAWPVVITDQGGVYGAGLISVLHFCIGLIV